MAAPVTPDFFPRDRYYCLLDEQPHFLVPQRLAGNGEGGQTPLVVNPRCWFGWYGDLPSYLASRADCTDNFFDIPWMVWVDDAVCGALWPFWLGPDYAHMLHTLTPGQRYEGGLPPEAVRVLRIAHILVEPDNEARRRQAWLAARESHAQQFARGYLPLSGLLHPFHLGALRRYYRYHVRMGTFVLGDAQTPRRYAAHEEPVARYFHRQLTTVVSDIARSVLLPSYNYLALYQGGAALDPHTDREACEYTVSVALDATPEPDSQTPWPLQLMTSDGPLSVWQNLGDGLLFRGRHLLHWRDRLADGHTSSSMLLHFIDANGYP